MKISIGLKKGGFKYFGKIPTPILMQITGHSKETTFLSYIGAQVNKDAYADAFIKAASTL